MARRHLRNPDDAQLRRVGWQLGIFTVALVSLLLLLAGFTVYVRAKDAMIGPLQQALIARAGQEGVDLENREGRVADSSHAPSTERFTAPLEPLTDNVFVAVANRKLQVTHHSPSPFGSHLPDPGIARAALAGRASFAMIDYRDHHYLLYAHPAVVDKRSVGVIESGILAEQYVEGLDALLHALLLVGGVGLLAAAGITTLVVRRALRPIRGALRRQREFVADAAHELRTPLTIIRSTSEIALAEGGESEQERAERVLRQSSHLTHLVEDLSLLARADTGAVSLQQQTVDLPELVRETVAGIAVLAEDQGIRLDLQLEEGMRVRGDPLRLRQLLLILLDNALKFTPPGGAITIRADHQRGHARLAIQDTGPGIAPADLPHLFERFYRSDRARSSEGTGLGLSIGQWIVEAHGGHISAANASHGGALFSATLPLAS